MDLVTHWNIGSKMACCHLVSDTEMWTACTSKTAPMAEIGVFRGLMVSNLYITHQNSCRSSTSLGCWLSPKMIPTKWNCAIWAVAWPQTPTQNYPFLAVFGTWKTPCTEIQQFFFSVCMQTSIHIFCFKNGQNQCRISGRKAALHW